jgi:superfamily II RNA helicase
MDILTRQNIEKQELSIFLRDLSADVNTNLKHMIEDMYKKADPSKDNIKKKKKNAPIKKKDIIIREQIEKRRVKDIEEDIGRVEYFLKIIDRNEPFSHLKKIKSTEGKVRYKYELLKVLWEEDKKKYMRFVIILFYELKEEDTETIESMDKDDRVMHRIEKTLRKCDEKDFMLEKMGNLLKPLDQWNEREKVLDDWQERVIDLVSKNESVVVKAPTSAGKSWIAMAAGIIHKKIIYVCPAKPVAYQVGAHFINMGYKVHFLLDNISHFSYSPQTNIFIGTPTEIENCLLKTGTTFDYAVFDEIHNVNKEEDGDIYENLLKVLKCNFLALSATINNIDFMVEKMKEINPKLKVNYIEYNQRFINHQRWVWKTDGLKKLHPLCAYNGVNDNYTDNSLSFTPNDCSVLWNKLYEIFDEIDKESVINDISPDEYFSDKGMLSLDDCRDYEKLLKNKMIELSDKFPEQIQEVFDSFKDRSETSKNKDFISFIRETKERKMFPMIMFHTNERECLNIFNKTYEYLNTKENEEYPYHYDILEKKEEIYRSLLDGRETYRDNLKVTSTNARYEIKEKMEMFDKKQKREFTSKVVSYYESKLNDIRKNDETNDNIKKLQEKNLMKEMNNFIVNPYFGPHDIFAKHTDFIFTTSKEPMSGDTIKAVRREIKNTLGIKIPYESPLFQMLKRGIGVYLESMPDEYNWQLQKLLSKKEIGIVISDKTLCLGIDLPVKTSCFLETNGNKFTQDEFLQMSGRAGRRGKDTQGNIIFFGDVDYLHLMKSGHPDIIGNTKTIYDNYKSLPIKYGVSCVFENMINPERKHEKISNATMDEEGRKLLWSLRSYKNACYFVLNLFSIEKELYSLVDSRREEHFLKKVSALMCDEDFKSSLDTYKKKKIEDYVSLKKIKEYSDVLMKIHNNIRKDKYMITLNLIKNIFSNMNKMTYNYII